MNGQPQSLASLLPQGAPIRETLRQADVFIADLENAGYAQQARDYRNDLIYQIELGKNAKSSDELPVIAQNINGIVSGLRGISKSSLSAPPKPEPTAPQEDQTAKAAMIQAAQAGFASRVEEATNRGVNVTPDVVSSISSLIGTGRTKEAAEIQDQIFGKVETSAEREIRIKAKKELEKAEEAAKLDKNRIVSTINRYVDSKGRPTQDLDNATGYFEESATAIAKIAPFLGTQSPKSRASQQELSREIEKSVLAAAANLKPVSNFELKLLEARRPQIPDPPEVWADYLSKVRDVIEKDPSRKENEEPRNIDEIQSATDKLRNRLKK